MSDKYVLKSGAVLDIDIDEPSELVFRDSDPTTRHGEFIKRRDAAELARVLQHFADHGTLPTPTPKGE